MRSTRRRSSLKAYTEKALEASELLIPSIVYMPRAFRPQKAMICADGLRIKISHADIMDNHQRIADADPLGFLIAIMQGQPLPEFNIDEKQNVTVSYIIPSIDDRKQCAAFLATRVTFKTPTAYQGGKPKGDLSPGQQHARDFDALVTQRTAGAE